MITCPLHDITQIRYTDDVIHMSKVIIINKRTLRHLRNTLDKHGVSMQYIKKLFNNHDKKLKQYVSGNRDDIEQFMKGKYYTKYDIAHDMNITPKTASRIINGKNKRFKIENTIRVHHVFGEGDHYYVHNRHNEKGEYYALGAYKPTKIISDDAYLVFLKCNFDSGIRKEFNSKSKPVMYQQMIKTEEMYDDLLNMLYDWTTGTIAFNKNRKMRKETKKTQMKTLRMIRSTVMTFIINHHVNKLNHEMNEHFGTDTPSKWLNSINEDKNQSGKKIRRIIEQGKSWYK